MSIRPGDYIIEVSEQTAPDGYPDCQRTIGRVTITRELMHDIENELLVCLIGDKVLRLVR
jgi:hypothetical protein